MRPGCEEVAVLLPPSTLHATLFCCKRQDSLRLPGALTSSWLSQWKALAPNQKRAGGLFSLGSLLVLRWFSLGPCSPEATAPVSLSLTFQLLLGSAPPLRCLLRLFLVPRSCPGSGWFPQSACSSAHRPFTTLPPSRPLLSEPAVPCRFHIPRYRVLGSQTWGCPWDGRWVERG